MSHNAATHYRRPDVQPIMGPTIQIYTWGFRISLALIIIGLLVGFLRGETLPDSLGSPGHVFRELSRGRGDGIIGVGILAMILTPLVGVSALALNFFRVHDRMFGWITVAIVVILIGSVAFSYL